MKEASAVELPPQAPQYRNSPLKVFGEHDEGTLAQMRNCMGVGNVVAGVICADGHLGYAQPVGGVIAYEGQISISGVGFDIGCGNMAVRLDTPYAAIAGPRRRDHRRRRARDLVRRRPQATTSGSSTRCSTTPMPGARPTWRTTGRRRRAQLGTVGSGNHYVDLMRDEEGFVWIGVHFGSRGLGHTSATRYLKAAGGKDGMHVPPAVVDEDERARAAATSPRWSSPAATPMPAASGWSSACAQIIGGTVTDRVHNHHNYAWRERHGERDLWVVRKGATPAFPGQRGFVGGSMGDDAVIIEGVESEESRAALYSTVHGAGRLFGRREAKRRFTRDEMDAWLKRARRRAGRRRSRREPDGLSPAARGAGASRRHDPGAAHAAPVRGRHGGRGRVRSVEGLARDPEKHDHRPVEPQHRLLVEAPDVAAELVARDRCQLVDHEA